MQWNPGPVAGGQLPPSSRLWNGGQAGNERLGEDREGMRVTPLVRYAALTMVHEEEVYFRLWLRHYGAMLGRENLYVITHGGESAITKMAKGCRLVYLPRDVVDGNFDASRFEVLNAYANFLLTQYDGLIAGDVDELVFVDPALGVSLVDFAEQHRAAAPALRAFGFNVFERSGEPPLDLNQPILSQRRHVRCEQDYCKPLVVYSRPQWSVGYHAVRGQPYLPTGLYLAHLHHVSTGVLTSIAEQRAETLAFNPQIRSSRAFRASWWGRRAKYGREYLRQMSEKPVEDFDDRIGGLVEELRANTVQSRWGGRGYTQMAFASQQDYVLRLPERFAQVF
jgi:hypothetical protein